MRSIKACAVLLLAMVAVTAASQAPIKPFATVGFACAGEEAGLVGCAAGEAQLSLDIFDQGAGEVGLKLTNQGEHRSTVTEVYLLDEAGLLRPETAEVQGQGLVHFRTAGQARPFPSAASTAQLGGGGGQQQQLADLALRRRTEVSRLGRLLRSNGVGNGAGDALTLLMRTTNEALDAELVADASHECLLRLAVVVTGFEEDPKAKRTFFSACGGDAA